MNLGFEQAISPRTKKLNPYQIFISKQTTANHKQMADLLSKNLEKVKKKNQLSQQLQNASFDAMNRVSTRPRPSINHEQEEKIGRISTTVKETMIELEECQIEQNGKPSQLFIDTNGIIIIQTKFRLVLAKKRLFKLKKQHRYRYMVLSELCSTEKSYCQILSILINNYMNPLKNILTPKEIKGLFSNIDSIYKLSQQTLEIFNEKLSNFGIHSIVADQELLSLTSFFKIYSEYLINYNQAFKLQMKLKKENPKYKQIIDQDKTKSLDNYYLIQPVQRIPKYVLLFKDLLKNTNLEHPDYKNIEKILQSFEKVANENNNQMEILLKNSKIFELQKQYGNFVKIVEAGREFIREESLQMYFTKEREVRPVIVYFLSDLILITERDQVKEHTLKTFIKINHISQCQKLPEMHHYQHVFQINGIGNSATFIVETKDSEKDIYDLIEIVEQMIRKLEEKYLEKEKRTQKDAKSDLQQGVAISIQGTQELLDASGKKFTQYIFEIDIKNITQKVFIRFSQFQKIQEEVKQKFEKIKLPYIKEATYFDRNEAAIVDQRKIGIVEFLQVLLNSKEFQSDITNQQNILTYIGLPENFYELPSLLSDKQKSSLLKTQFSFRSSKKPQSMHIDSCENITRIKNFDQSATTLNQAITPRGPVKPMADVVQMLQQTEMQKEQPKPPSPNIKGLRATSLANSRKISATQLITMESRGTSRQGSMVGKEQLNLQMVKIKVYVFQSFKQNEKEYSITKDTSAFQLLEEIAADIKLASSYDFRLYQIDNHYLKPLDHDEKLWNLLVKIDDSKGLFRKAQKIPVYNQKKIQLRKHLYVNEEEEKQFYQSDIVRLELISYQLFDDISSFKLQLPLKDHVVNTAFYLYFNGHKKIDPKNIPINEIKEVLVQLIQFVPQIVFKSIPQEQWINFLPTLFSNFAIQIKDLQDQENQKLLQKQQIQQEEKRKIKKEHNDQLTESSQGEGEKKTEKHYAMYVFLDLIKSTRFYGVTNYPVRPDKESLKYISELSKVYWENKKKYNKGFENHQIEDCLCWQSLYLSVSHKSLIILQSLKSQLEQLEIDYADISSISSLQQSLAIYLDQMPTHTSSLQINKKMCLKFETEKSFQIKSLIDEYVKIQIDSQQVDNLLCDEILDNK